MPRLQRKFRHGETYFVTNRTARGLPFVANDFMNAILGGVLARALQLYDGIAICGWIFMGNHYHAIITITGCGMNMRSFMNYVDGEVAKCINRLMGISNQNVWAGRFEARPLLTTNAILDKLAYMYCNPAKANLVDKIEEFPGLSTWKQFTGAAPTEFKWIKPSELEQLPRQGFTSGLMRSLLEMLDTIERDVNELTIEPFAWMTYMHDAKQLTQQQVIDKVITEVSRLQALHIQERKTKKKGIVTALALSSQSIYKYYRPNSWTRSTSCISTCAEIAAQYRREYRDFCAACRRTWLEWKHGNVAAKYPPGAFLPSTNPLSCIWV